ncbi:hypothetical protein OF375_02420 [Ureaplasma miroungigenitalium]|uniref:hypothetical protein n=1 Tax=Ureaplasma miroungigenitalium TaxID=1042321 RepID=UPI0021E79D76|nr:hypothetical protein [Ureaplasma miroungigenitalium]MCV3734420.1 hypothetical protein [Ureaplasma miroungigenitalium]
MKSTNNFKKPKSKLQIVLAKVIRYDDQAVYLQLKDNSYAYCLKHNVSDFEPIDIAKIFAENKYYKFMYLFYDHERKMPALNYKIIHPILIKNKKKSYPTLSHDRNLKQFLNELLAKEE